MRLSHKKDGIGFRAGLGSLAGDGETWVAVPIGLNYIASKDNKNYFELGATFTHVSFTSNIVDSDNFIFASSFGSLTIGYRRQPQNGAFIFRAALTPVFGRGRFYPYYGGISFGYAF